MRRRGEGEVKRTINPCVFVPLPYVDCVHYELQTYYQKGKKSVILKV